MIGVLEESPLNLDAQLFIDDASEALQFATDILQQLPQTDPRRERLAEQLNQRVSEFIQQHAEAANALFDPDSVEDPAFQQAAQILQGEATPLEQMRVLRGYYGSRIWSAVIETIQALLSPEQKYELGEISNYTEMNAFFDEYAQMISQARDAHAENLLQVQNELQVQEQLYQKVTESNKDLHHFQQERKQTAVEMEQAALDTAKRCDELLEDISKLRQIVDEKREEAQKAAYSCKLVIHPAKKNKKLLTLQQTVQQINEIYTAKQKHDVACLKQGKQLESSRVYLYQYFSIKYGVEQMKRSQHIATLLYSVGYYRDTNAVCGIFAAELALEIDEAFKLNVLKLEKKIDELRMPQCQQILQIIYQDEQITQLILSKMAQPNDFQELKNQINLFELERHRITLEKFRELFLKFDVQRLGRIPYQQFKQLCDQMGVQNSDAVVAAARKGTQHSVVFTNAVLALNQWIFAFDGEEENPEGGEEQPEAAELKQTQGLKVGDL